MADWYADFTEIVLWCIVVALPTRVLGNALRRRIT